MSSNVKDQNVLRTVLKESFGYDQFRGNQERIIQNLLNGQDTFVIMPTGAGKSMCYQLPSLLKEGTAVIISPLIALMKNQVDQMVARGIKAAFLNSTLTKAESTRTKKAVLSGELKLLYVAPESLTKLDNIEFFKQANVSFVAVDEVHCISEWGHDFRPEYRRIRSILDQIGSFPLIALTATATPKVQLDIQKNLQMDQAKLFKSSFFRNNLFYEVRPKSGAKKYLIEYLSKRKGKSGIIYCLSRKKVEELAGFLQLNGFNARPYHAGFDSQVRIKNQDDFLNEDVDIIVATIAFGMGIDKPDVRFVVHFDAPKSLEGYYQETGRAGRDSKQSDCLMFYTYSDILKLDKFNKDKPVAERDNSRVLLEEVTGYAESSQCRTRQLLHYFGEHLEEDCGNCDNCKNPPVSFEAKDEITWVLETVRDTKERFGLRHLVNIIRGSKAQEVISYEHDKLNAYGKGKDQNDFYWTSLVRQVLINELIEKDIDNYSVYKLSDLGREFIKSPKTLTFTQAHEYPEVTEEDVPENSHGKGQAFDKPLFELLKELRKKEADKHDLPPYVIFQEESLEEMATTYPTSTEDLSHVQGVGTGKANKFGKPFVALIDKYAKDNNIDVVHEVFVKTSANKSKNKIAIIQLIDKKVDLPEIAESISMSYDKLLEELEHICHSGTKVDIDYYIDDILDEDSQEDIYSYFMEADSDDMEDAFEELGDDYEEEEIHLMHIKFISEVAI